MPAEGGAIRDARATAFWFGRLVGSRGSMASQRSSGTRDDAFMARYHPTPTRF